MVQRKGQHLPVRVGVMPISFGGEALAMPVRGQRAQICPSRIDLYSSHYRSDPQLGEDSSVK